MLITAIIFYNIIKLIPKITTHVIIVIIKIKTKNKNVTKLRNSDSNDTILFFTFLHSKNNFRVRKDFSKISIKKMILKSFKYKNSHLSVIRKDEQTKKDEIGKSFTFYVN